MLRVEQPLSVLRVKQPLSMLRVEQPLSMLRVRQPYVPSTSFVAVVHICVAAAYFMCFVI